MGTIVDSVTGQEIYATTIEVDLKENEELIPELRTEHMENPYFNFTTRQFFDKI